jgi:predicted phage-related endonuclease
MTEPQPVPLDHIEHWVKTLGAANAKVAEFQQIAKVARAQIEAALGDAEVGTIAGRPAVRWITITARRIDQAKLRANYPDLAAELTAPTVSRRFTLVEDEQ